MLRCCCHAASPLQGQILSMAYDVSKKNLQLRQSIPVRTGCWIRLHGGWRLVACPLRLLCVRISTRFPSIRELHSRSRRLRAQAEAVRVALGVDLRTALVAVGNRPALLDASPLQLKQQLDGERHGSGWTYDIPTPQSWACRGLTGFMFCFIVESRCTESQSMDACLRSAIEVKSANQHVHQSRCGCVQICRAPWFAVQQAAAPASQP